MLPVHTQGLWLRKGMLDFKKSFILEARIWTVRPAYTIRHADPRMATSLFFILCMSGLV